MGQVKISVGALRGQPSTRAWYPLLDSDKNNTKKNGGATGEDHLRTQGEIELKVRWLFNPELAVPMFEDVPEVSAIYTLYLAALRCAALRCVALHGTAQPSQLSLCVFQQCFNPALA